MGVFLLLSDWKSFRDYFFKSNKKEQLIPKIIPEKVRNLYWLKFLIIPVMVFYSYKYIADIKKVFLVKNELFGVWEITPRNANVKIDRFYIDYDDEIKVRDTLDNQYYGDMELNVDEKELSFKADHYSDRAYYFINDSIEKLDVEENEVENVRKKIRAFYNTKNKTLPIELNYNYTLKGDTLILIGKNRMKYLNITDKYKN
jgi:hypothetical protein